MSPFLVISRRPAQDGPQFSMEGGIDLAALDAWAEHDTPQRRLGAALESRAGQLGGGPFVAQSGAPHDPARAGAGRRLPHNYL